MVVDFKMQKIMIKNPLNIVFILTLLLIIVECCFSNQIIAQAASYTKDNLPLPYSTKSYRNFSKVIGWPAAKTPIAPAGFKVTKFADNLVNPRWIYVADNGDIFVAESNTILTGIKKFGAKI